MTDKQEEDKGLEPREVYIFRSVQKLISQSKDLKEFEQKFRRWAIIRFLGFAHLSTIEDDVRPRPTPQ